MQNGSSTHSATEDKVPTGEKFLLCFFARSHFSTLRIKSILLVRPLLQELSKHSFLLRRFTTPERQQKICISIAHFSLDNPEQPRVFPCASPANALTQAGSCCRPGHRPGCPPRRQPRQLPRHHRGKQECQKEKEKKGRKSNFDPRCKVWTTLLNSWKSAVILRGNRQH